MIRSSDTQKIDLNMKLFDKKIDDLDNIEALDLFGKT